MCADSPFDELQAYNERNVRALRELVKLERIELGDGRSTRVGTLGKANETTSRTHSETATSTTAFRSSSRALRSRYSKIAHCLLLLRLVSDIDEFDVDSLPCTIDKQECRQYTQREHVTCRTRPVFLPLCATAVEQHCIVHLFDVLIASDHSIHSRPET